MKKYIVVLLLIIFIIPSMALASWWNPFSWFTKQPKVEQTTPVINNPIIINTGTPKTTSVSVNNDKKTTANSAKKKSTPVYDVCKNIEGIQTIVPAGMYADNGNCFAVVVKTDQQKCEDSFGYNSSYTGQKNQNGDLVCGCKSGYDWNNNRTSCIVIPAKTGYQVCSEQFPNGTWDGTMANGKYNCVCQNGYVLNDTGTACQIQATQDQTKAVQIQALKQEYNDKISAFNQQILDIKNQYYIDLKNIDGSGTWTSRANGEKQNLLTNANAKIDQLNTQIQQLYIDYTKQINNISSIDIIEHPNPTPSLNIPATGGGGTCSGWCVPNASA